jgi:RNA polymerase sigma-70 factor (ECF subfamily)
MPETNSPDPSLIPRSVMMAEPLQAQPDAGSLYRAHMHQVARWAERLAGPTLDVEDIVSEVFLIAHERLASFRGDSSLSTWLFGITDRVVRHRRRKERWRRWLAGSADETAGHLPGTGPDPLRVAERNQAAARVYRVLDRLGERDRQILILCELEELTAEEVGELLGIQPGNARLRLHRARARFLRVYEDYERTQQSERSNHVGG